NRGWGTDRDAIRDIEEAFKKDHERVEQLKREGKLPADTPDLSERSLHPRPPEDQLLQTHFNIAIHKTMDDDFYQKYAKPLLENGYLSLEQKADLGPRYFKHAEKPANQRFEDVVNTVKQAEQEKAEAKRQAEAKGVVFDEKAFHGPATDEIARIQQDKAFKEKVLDGLNDDDRQVALNVL